MSKRTRADVPLPLGGELGLKTRAISGWGARRRSGSGLFSLQ